MVVVLALLAVLLGRRRYAIPFFAGAILLFLDLAATPSLSRRLFDLIPYFAQLHDHRPTGAMYLVCLPLAMLAGAGVQLLLTAPPAKRAWLWPLLPLPILLLALSAVQRHGAPVSPRQAELAILATGLLVLAATRLPARWPRVSPRAPQLIAIALLGLSLLYPTGHDFLWAMRAPNDTSNNLLSANPTIRQTTQTILSRHDPGTPAALMQFLQATQPPFRYAAYFGTGSVDDPHHSSTAIKMRPSIVEILAGSRSAMLGLAQISGYNPLHLADYAHYVDVMNGARQNYHWLDIHAAALSSQLLDMLNVRYILVSHVVKHPLNIPEGTVIYQDDLITIYENGRAFPRAWLVHEVRPDNNGAG